MSFDREIESQLQSLEQSAESDAADIEALLKCVDDIQHKVKEQLGSISTHDREKYDSRLQQVREKIWKLKKPKRFQFKKTTHPKTIARPQGEPRPDVSVQQNSPKTSATELSRILMFEPEEQTSLNLSNLEKSVVIAHSITGAIHITNVRQSRIVARCAQCRIHDCVNIEVQLEGCKNPIIENSSGVKFYTRDSERLHVSDFSWMRPEPDPNFSLKPLPTFLNDPISSYTYADAKEMSDLMKR